MATILLIDDDPDMFALFNKVLTVTGHRVEWARNGIEGVEVLAELKPDLAIIDLNLPFLDGFGVLKSMRNDPHTKDTPAIVLSVHDEGSNRDEAYQHGASAFVAKPIDVSKFLSLVKNSFNPAA